ncbi:predicted protein [Scheffersomyces stipitis CBS 6054]|uniref:Karyogamy protein KAR4 n=1 Tax=Scheffersomyces stipitis (strain ATCC 58785 / CBS 6054 / NBRC 10063 / NRRL Y-11545) TaxID=322104 RepID=A3LR14_PICST|nr:predicted protein [Scheffersomyces stipitis CBS 6054]ABN65305.2 predicted protein [Scheffersomyces stipitis CBS 6054]KAG2733719.1 hypothetical protein G9P44_003244 [Scheffersomyces stipitis]
MSRAVSKSRPSTSNANHANRYTYNKFGSRKESASTRETAIAGSLESSRSSRENQNQNHNQNLNPKKISASSEIDYCNHYIHTKQNAISQIRNIANPTEGYPKLSKLHQLKRAQVEKHATTPYGVRVATDKIIPTINSWIDNYGLKFDVIMIGALVENQFILPLLNSIPISKLCAKPGFLFIWATTQKIIELTSLLNNDNFNKKFRRSEELIFLPVDKDSPYYPDNSGDSVSLLEKQQWHCWMCITGTVRRSTDNHLIHCNVDTDLQIESAGNKKKSSVPEAMYRVAENFSNSNRRLHIIPSKTGYDCPIKIRKGWVIMGPDVILNNFDPMNYSRELNAASVVQYNTYANGSNTGANAQYLVPQTNEIEDLRPKSPVSGGKKTNST